METTVLPEAEWVRRAETHAARLDPYLGPHLARRRAGLEHPVHDFLFDYYSLRPGQLRRWHPGFGTALCGPQAASYTTLKGYCGDSSGGVTVSVTFVGEHRPLIESLHALLVATAGRPPSFGCFGLHEWAMVYHLTQEETRHHAWPLRLGCAGTDAVVDSHRIACSHFDAFRFFTPDARPLNALDPRADNRPDFEQPGCLHATMDLYKHAFRLSPMICSDLVADCFELAWDARDLDMRGSAYDVSELGYEPIRIETPEGKQEYAVLQRALSERAEPLRRRLIEECDRLLGSQRG